MRSHSYIFEEIQIFLLLCYDMNGSNVIGCRLIRNASLFIRGFEKRFGLLANELVLITHSILLRRELNT